YTTLAQLAIQLKFFAEAQAVLEKGQAAKVLTDDRTNKLLALAKTQAAAAAANQAKDLAAAKAAPKGDALVRVGEDMWGQGKGKEAVAVIKEGIAKGVDDKNNAQIRLGMALIAAGQKSEAVKALDAAKAANPNDKSAMVAHLWSLYARH
ncbi:MAG: tetratricopeptide repeat protein, partial [Alphaproteobacteria bacterium]|nr:tetratricopeptide repeat protein [Alphaproteobacteria bacterium]